MSNDYQKDKESYISRNGEQAWKDYQRQKKLRRQDKNPVRAMLIDSRHSAKKRGIEFSIDVYNTDLQIPDVCPVLGIPLFRMRGKRGGGANSPSVDRIDNSKGYVDGNVQIISFRANSLKADATIEELERVVEHMKKITQKQ